MLKEFEEFIRSGKLFEKQDKILLAVSGGRDSVAMTDLFIRSGYHCAIAHCNFNLRGRESDEDEVFTKKLAEKYHCKFYAKEFPTEEYAQEKRMSVQMAARELRYAWFEELLVETGFDCVATGHHRDDETETFMINLIRGTGPRGLAGIPVKRDRIVRPLLFTGRDEIDRYIAAQGLEYREDSSNKEEKYLRNKVRHSIIPLLETLNPDFSSSLVRNMTKIRDMIEIVDRELDEFRRDEIITDSDGIRIPLEKLLEMQPLSFWLFELLRDYNFSFDTAERLADSMGNSAGKHYLSSTHRLLVEREYLLVQKLAGREETLKDRLHFIDKNTREILYPVKLKFDYFNAGEIEISSDPAEAFIDPDKLTYPLILRKWREGDTFRPLGMKGTKKLSDFFIDNKIEISQKEKTWLLCCGDEIVWVVGLRLDDRFRITRPSGKTLRITLL